MVPKASPSSRLTVFAGPAVAASAHSAPPCRGPSRNRASSTAPQEAGAPPDGPETMGLVTSPSSRPTVLAGPAAVASSHSAPRCRGPLQTRAFLTASRDAGGSTRRCADRGSGNQSQLEAYCVPLGRPLRPLSGRG
eukprot:15433803-Alexandrium_andersonii.AAC.1